MATEERDNAIDQLERDFLSKSISDDDTKAKLVELFGNDDHFWILFDMRKHNIPYGA